MSSPHSASSLHSETARALSLQIAFAKEPGATAPEASLFGSVWHAAAPTAPTAGAEPGIDIQVDMPLLLQGAPGLMEQWLVKGAVREGMLGAARYRCNEDLLFVAISMSEQNGDQASDIANAAHQAYASLFKVMEAEAFPHLVRCWNYFADINKDQIELAAGGQSGPMERYRLFNIGRQLAFEASEHSADVGAPAACALGTQGGPLVVYALAARTEPRCVENPRQVSAYRYPERYGPKSPSFSRGSVLTGADGEHILFVSGTASIIGHESVHLGDVIEQTRESLRNIATVVTQANLGLGREVFSLHKLCYKVFVRHPDDALAVADTVRRTLGNETINMVVLRADVCRAELLVEIEAVGFA